MQTLGGDIFVGVIQRRVLVKVTGRGTQLNSHLLRQFCAEMLQRGYRRFELDFGYCTSMDSTFLGVLASLGLRLRGLVGGRVEIQRISQRNLELMRTLGIDRLFDTSSAQTVPAPVELVALPLSVPRSEEVARTSLEAHRLLSRLDEANEPRFRDVVQFLTEEVARSSPERDRSQLDQKGRSTWKD